MWRRPEGEFTILVILMGWQFMVAEFIGAPLMVGIMALLFKTFLSPEFVTAAKKQADDTLQTPRITYGRNGEGPAF